MGSSTLGAAATTAAAGALTGLWAVGQILQITELIKMTEHLLFVSNFYRPFYS